MLRRLWSRSIGEQPGKRGSPDDWECSAPRRVRHVSQSMLRSEPRAKELTVMRDVVRTAAMTHHQPRCLQQCRSFDGRCTCISVIHFRPNPVWRFRLLRISTSDPKTRGAVSLTYEFNNLVLVVLVGQEVPNGTNSQWCDRLPGRTALETWKAFSGGWLAHFGPLGTVFSRRRLGVQGRVRPRPRTLEKFSTCDLR